MAERPIVLENISLLDAVQYTIDRHKAPSIILVCSSKQSFIDELLLAQRLRYSIADIQVEDDDILTEQPEDPWSVPTLRLLASTRTIKLVFCADVPHLRAYMAALCARSPQSTGRNALGLLLLLNPIHMHQITSSFSAQGFNRTFSGAVEAAHNIGSQLVIVESQPASPQSVDPVDEDGEEGVPDVAPQTANPWDQELSMLNVTTKGFGDGERGWAGRTVKLRTVAERWCRFETWTGAA